MSTATPRIANSACRAYVQERRPFKGNNLWGEWYETGFVNDDGSTGVHRRYVVYSYRYTWPLFIYDPVCDQWYENRDKVSRTTTKHKGQAHPLPVGRVISLSVSDMLEVARYGAVGLIRKAQEDVERGYELAQDIPF